MRIHEPLRTVSPQTGGIPCHYQLHSAEPPQRGQLPFQAGTDWRAAYWQRYRRIGRFLLTLCLHLLWWDGLCRLPLLRQLRPAAERRWAGLAQRYCALAMREGGLWVKAGQFLSLRSDLLPLVVIQALTTLQDSMEPAPFAAIVAALERDLARPLPELFREFVPQPVASASVAQVHLARLYSGEQVVVKVIRPGTPEQFAMDLATFGWGVTLLNLMPWVRRRFNLGELLAEFTMVTRNELNLQQEGRNAERFAQAFRDQADVYIPKVYWSHSGIRTLTMENVGYLKLSDVAAIEATGIKIPQVARNLAQLILQQIFVTHFVHADPHPGNVFVKPLPHPQERKAQFLPGDAVAYHPERRFQIVLIDFGMAIEIPPKERLWLRDFVIGLGLRDERRIVQAYSKGGILRPGMDLERVEAYTAALLDGFQELLVGMLPDPADPKTQRFFQKYGDLLGKNYPFQIPMNLLFMYRALGTVGAVVKQLDPTLELSSVAAPFAIQLFVEEWQQDLQSRWEAVGALSKLLATAPLRLDQLFLQAQKVFQMPDLVNEQLRRPLRGLTVKTELAPTDRATFETLSSSVRRLNRSLALMGALALALFWYIVLQRTDLVAILIRQAEHFGGPALALSFTLAWWNWLRGRG